MAPTPATPRTTAGTARAAGTKPRTEVDESPWQEWTIGVCVTVLALLAVWTVFGDDLGHLFQPGTAPAPPPQTATQKR
jgi:hypothetical protein